MEKDPDIERNRSVMEQIWGEVPKEHRLPPHFSGEYIRYVQTDPKYLYLTGFVDTKKYTLEEWEAAFEDCKQSDNTYLISKEKFIQLGKYKYAGPIKKPLDPMKLREGWYDINQWHEFCVRSIIPSTVLTVEHLVQAEKLMKEGGQIINGKILVDKAVKLRIKKVLDDFPSPTRYRELGVEAVHQKIIEEEVARSQSPTVKTTFVKGQKVGDTKKKELKETLLKASKITSPSKGKIQTLNLKDLRKKSKAKKTSV